MIIFKHPHNQPNPHSQHSNNSVLKYCKEVFPTVGFTGGSDIHASKFQEVMLPFSFSKAKEIMQLIVKQDYPERILKIISNNFGEMNFFISPDDFIALALTDFHGHLTSNGDSKSEKKLRNPVTGNRFHRIAVYKDLIGGVRFWVEPFNEYVTVGFRFRLERMLEETEENLRSTVEESVRIANTELESIKESMEIPVEIPEPYTEQVPTRVRIQDY